MYLKQIQITHSQFSFLPNTDKLPILFRELKEICILAGQYHMYLPAATWGTVKTHTKIYTKRERPVCLLFYITGI